MKKADNGIYNHSDHYDGKRFFNPNLPTHRLPNFFSALKMLLTSNNTAWPKYLINKAEPQLNQALNEGDIALTFVNHATFLIQFPGLTILTDPVWSKRVSPFSWLGPKRVRDPGIDFSQLPNIDLILLSHNHYDHLDRATLKKLINKGMPTVIVPLGDKKRVEKIGFQNVIAMDWWDTQVLNDKTRISFTPTQHFSSRSLFDRCKSLWGGFVIQHQETTVYFGGDAGYSNHYTEIAQRFGTIHLALIGIGAYEPQWFMQPMHMNPKEAVQAHLDLRAAQSVGMHFGTFQLSSEGIDKPIIDLKMALKDKQLPNDSFITLVEGQTRVFNWLG